MIYIYIYIYIGWELHYRPRIIRGLTQLRTGALDEAIQTLRGAAGEADPGTLIGSGCISAYLLLCI